MSHEKAEHLLWEFVEKTIIGHESGFYKLFVDTNDLLKSSEMKLYYHLATINYLNQAYKALILDSDEYFMKYFNGISNVTDHSQICLLNISLAIILDVHNKIDRAQLDTTSYESYMNSVHTQLKNMKVPYSIIIETSLSHECKGENIKDCDPNEDLFYIK